MATLFVDKVDPQSGTSLEIGSSGDTISVPSGATINLSNATQTGVGGVNTPSFFAHRNGSGNQPSVSAIIRYTKAASNGSRSVMMLEVVIMLLGATV